MDRGGFKVEGLSRVVRDLKALGVEVDDLKDAFGAIAADGARIAASYAPSRSGRLRSTLRGNRAQSKAVVTAGRASVPYAGAINYGWPRRSIRAAGFMQKADEAIRPKAIERLQDDINAAIARKGFQ